MPPACCNNSLPKTNCLGVVNAQKTLKNIYAPGKIKGDKDRKLVSRNVQMFTGPVGPVKVIFTGLKPFYFAPL